MNRFSLILALGVFFSFPAGARDIPLPGQISSRYDLYNDEIYSRIGSRQLLADVYVPEGRGPFPAVLVVHGGGWSGGKRTEMNFIARRLAKHRYVAVNIDYRLAPKDIFPAQIHDCKEAVRWMRANSVRFKIDPNRVGAFGYSAGAHLAALLGVTRPSDGLEGESELGSLSSGVQAVVAGAGPMDLKKDPKSRRIVQFLGATFEQNPEIFRKASPVTYVSKGDPPMFLYHGQWDRTVALSHSTDMKRALEDAGVPSQFLLIHGMGHIAVFLFNRSAIEKAIRFLDINL